MGPVQSGINQIINTAAFGVAGMKFSKHVKKNIEENEKGLKFNVKTSPENAAKIKDLDEQAENIRSEGLPEYERVNPGNVDASISDDELTKMVQNNINEMRAQRYRPIGNDITKDVMTKKMKQAEDMEKMKETLKNPEQEIPLEIEPKIGNQMATEAIETRLNQNEKFEELKKEVEISEYDVDDSNALDQIFNEKPGRKLTPYELKRDSVRKELFNLQNVTTTSEGIGKFYEKRVNPIEKELKAIRKNENYEDIDRILKEHFNLDRETFLKDEFMNDIANSLYRQPLDKIVKRIEYYASQQPGNNKEGMFFYDLYDPIIRQALYYEADSAETYLNVLTGGNK